MARAPFIYKTRARINFYYADAATTTDTDTNTDPDAAAITATTAIKKSKKKKCRELSSGAHPLTGEHIPQPGRR